jgi:hypothetical protein
LKQRLEEFELERLQSLQDQSQNDTSSESNVTHDKSEPFDFTPYHNHLQQAWEVWKMTPEHQKSAQWHLEVLRAYSNAQDERIELSKKLVLAESQNNHLKIQLERLNECQQPKEFTFQIPTLHSVDEATTKILISQKADIAPDRETLITKWTNVVKENSKFQRALPDIGLGTLSPGQDGMEIVEGFAEGGQADEEADEGDSADAAGEDDDDDGNDDGDGNGEEVVSQRNGTNSVTGVNNSRNSTSFIDPSLRTDQDNSMDVDGGDFGAEILLADMRARAQRNNNGL